jgi:hypothetical protein
MSNDLHALEKLVARLRKVHGPDVLIRPCYEAGPCGFGVARRLEQAARPRLPGAYIQSAAMKRSAAALRKTTRRRSAASRVASLRRFVMLCAQCRTRLSSPPALNR